MSLGLVSGGLTDSDEHPWERQRGESRQAYAAWTAYRDMVEPRSYRRVARDLNRSATLIGGWGTKWRWQQRLGFYLAHIEKVRMSERIRAIAEMNKRHASVAKQSLDKISEALEAIGSGELPLSLIPKLLATAVAIERTALGLPPSNNQPEALTDSKETCPTERSAPLNEVEERIRALSSIDRGLLRRISLKYMDLLIVEASEAESEQADADPQTPAN